MPNVSLISFTGIGHPDPLYAARLLAFTKNTRLNIDTGHLDSFMELPEAEILKEIEYMATTIPSSWEFADLVFLVTRASRATAQQVTRTRTASFAMQSQRVSDMRDVTHDERAFPLTIELNGMKLDVSYEQFFEGVLDNYQSLVDAGMPLEDARDLLPIGVHCNLVAKYNLRGLVDLCRARNSLRVQGPYVEIADKMKAEVIRVWPWAAPFFTPPQSKVIGMIEEVAKELAALGGEKGAMYKGLSGKLAKAADLLKKD